MTGQEEDDPDDRDPPHRDERKQQSLKNKLLLLGFGAGVSPVLVEGFFVLCLAFPMLASSLPSRMLNGVRIVYMNGDRSILQFEPEGAQYDSQLLYRLRPGEFVHRNREFASLLRVNSLGVRDDEDSLRRPEIIVLGDSFAMGWGVQQEETFAQRIERELGRKVLNAAVPSYGTVRELLILNRIDTRNLRILIVQYSHGDANEARRYRLNDNRLNISGEERYRKAIEQNDETGSYYPGKHLITFLAYGLFKSDRPPPPNDDQIAEVVRDFLHALQNVPEENLEAVQLVVFEVAQNGAGDSRFIRQLRNETASGEYPPYIKEMMTVDFSDKLEADVHYFILDDHINAEGHGKIAGILDPVTFQSMRQHATAKRLGTGG